MNKEDYKKQFAQEDTVGWNAINEQLKTVYGETEPRHYAPPLHYIVGGPDPIDGISVYDSEKQSPHFHMISYGMSELYYDEEKAGGDFSKWGFEFTIRLAPFEGDQGDPLWAAAMMNNLARYVFDSGKWFEEYHFIPANGPIRLDTDTAIVGLVFVKDPELGTIDTPHGEVTFLQMVGITAGELERLNTHPEKVEDLIKELKENNPLLITDLKRKD